ncbi:MAG: hypothetical protein QXK37_02710 [Candidatus Woesearchaeota archaeon]
MNVEEQTELNNAAKLYLETDRAMRFYARNYFVNVKRLRDNADKIWRFEMDIEDLEKRIDATKDWREKYKLKLKMREIKKEYFSALDQHEIAMASLKTLFFKDPNFFRRWNMLTEIHSNTEKILREKYGINPENLKNIYTRDKGSTQTANGSGGPCPDYESVQNESFQKREAEQASQEYNVKYETPQNDNIKRSNKAERIDKKEKEELDKDAIDVKPIRVEKIILKNKGEHDSNENKHSEQDKKESGPTLETIISETKEQQDKKEGMYYRSYCNTSGEYKKTTSIKCSVFEDADLYHSLISYLNKHPNASVGYIIKNSGIEGLKNERDVRYAVERALKSGFYISRYNSNFAPTSMKKEVIREYCTNYSKPLRTLAEKISKKYNMNISQSTMRRLVRKELGYVSRMNKSALLAYNKRYSKSEMKNTFRLKESDANTAYAQ